MKLVKQIIAVTLMIVMAGSYIPAHALTEAPNIADQESEAMDLLIRGILQSSPQLVELGLKKGASPKGRIGRYGDTFLMAALRIYCQSLANRAEYAYKKYLLKVGIALISGSIITYLLYMFALDHVDKSSVGKEFFTTIKKYKGLNACLAGFGAGITIGVLAPVGPSYAPDKVVDLLINIEPSIAARNKEGLDAQDILKAYYPIAYQLKDDNWFRYLQIIKTRMGQEVGNAHDITTDLTSL